MKRILAISGSTKPNSSNWKILDFISVAAGKHVIVELYKDLAELPYFVPGLENDQIPPAVRLFFEKIETADAVLFSSPEYVYSLPGILKNALEWTVQTTVLSGKPTAFIIAATSGEKACESLDLILETLTQENIPKERKILIKSAGKYFNGDSGLNDDQLRNSLTTLIAHLLSA